MSQEVGARYCKLELSGESNLYLCPRDEFCCNVGCCIPPTFQHYQLWYYWFMVFFMFLICSGGQWWYRYVMQGRCASGMPPPQRRASYPRQCRVAYTPASDTVVLHHLWKPSYPGMNGPPPSYSQSGAGSSTGVGGLKASPYVQLYGPPPSYESVVASGPVPIHQPPPQPVPLSYLPPFQQQPSPPPPPPPFPPQSSLPIGPQLISSHHHHHRRQMSSGNSSQQAQVNGATPQHGHVRRCSAPHHHPHPHHFQHSQKAVVDPEERGEGCGNVEVNLGNSPAQPVPVCTPRQEPPPPPPTQVREEVACPDGVVVTVPGNPPLQTAHQT